MDAYSVATMVSLLSAFVMLAAIIYLLVYIIRSFSSKSGILTGKYVLLSLVYFFGSTIFLFTGSYWLSDMARIPVDGSPLFLNVGASALMMSVILHIFCGSLVALIYLRDKYRTRRSIGRFS